MLSIFVMLLIAVAVTAGIGYGILTMIKSGEASLGIQKNQARLEQIAISIRSSIKYEDGKILIPVTMDGTNVTTTLPSVSPYTMTAYGKPIIYCPITAENPSARTFASATQEYVLAGTKGSDTLVVKALFDKNVVAYMISPAPYAGEGTVLDCNSVTMAVSDANNTTVLIEGGSVTPIFAVEPATIGTGQDFTVGTVLTAPMTARRFETFADVVEHISENRVIDATIWLPTTVEVLKVDMDLLASSMNGRTLRLKGNNTTLNVTDSSGNVTFDGNVFVDDVVTNISLVAAASSVLDLNEVTAEKVIVDGGKVILRGGSVIASSSFVAPVDVNGGEFEFQSPASISAGNSPTVVNVNGGTLHITGIPKVTANAAASFPVVTTSGNGRITGSASLVQLLVNRGAGR